MGFVCLSFVEEAKAEGYLTGAVQITLDHFGKGRAGLVFAFRAADPSATRFLTRCLRDTVFAEADSVRFVRAYGSRPGRKPRAVIMRRQAGAITARSAEAQPLETQPVRAGGNASGPA